MTTQEELKKIKKMYGERFMHLYRTLFPTILENEGQLYEMLTSLFSTNNKTLYDDIVDLQLEYDFKKYIYSKLDDEKNIKIIENKTPYELLDEAGYELIECHTEEEIQSFKKYYAEGEELCTFSGNRLDRCVVFWAVKKDVQNIKRENFNNPEREDEYGTSVMSIQFDKGSCCRVSIKNRYNHTVVNPDATYGNNLENIIPGLTQSFANLLQERDLLLDDPNVSVLNLPDCTIADDGKYYKYNMELDGIYYCPGNIVIDHGKVEKLPETQILIDNFILDTQNKEIHLYDEAITDSFIDDLQDIRKVEVRKKSENGKKTREIIISKENQTEPVIIEIDENNEIVGYTNNGLEKARDNFLFCNRKLSNLHIPELTQVGDGFLCNNQELTDLDLPKLTTAKDTFLTNNQKISNLNLPELTQVGGGFLRNNQELTDLNLPKLTKVGDGFLSCNYKLSNLHIPELAQVGNNFLYRNEELTNLNLLKLTQVGDGFLRCNQELTTLNLPKLTTTGCDFLGYNTQISSLNLPELTQVGDGFLYSNEELTSLNLPKLTTIKGDGFYGFLSCNSKISSLQLSELTEAGNNFLYCNDELTDLELPNLKRVGNNFLAFNQKLTILETPELTQAGNDFLKDNQELTSLNLPYLKEVGNNFLASNQKITSLELPELAQAGNYFLKNNKGLTILELPNLEKVGNSFLGLNKKLTSLKLPKVTEVGHNFLKRNTELTDLEFPRLRIVNNGFLQSNKKLTRLQIPNNPKVERNFASIIKKNLKSKGNITAKDIAILDKNSQLTTSEVENGAKIISDLTKDLTQDKDRM